MTFMLDKITKITIHHKSNETRKTKNNNTYYVRENNRWKKTSLQSMAKRSHTHTSIIKKRLNGSTAVTGDSVLQVTLKI